MDVTHGNGPYGGYSVAEGDYLRWRIRQECERVGCTAHTMWVVGQFEETIRHGDQRYQLMGGPYRSAWQGLVGWLDTLHAPSAEEAKHAEAA